MCTPLCITGSCTIMYNQCKNVRPERWTILMKLTASYLTTIASMKTKNRLRAMPQAVHLTATIWRTAARRKKQNRSGSAELVQGARKDQQTQSNFPWKNILKSDH